MAKLFTCDCGRTVISPQGEPDVAKHAMTHLHDAHPGMKMTEEQTKKMIKSV